MSDAKKPTQADRIADLESKLSSMLELQTTLMEQNSVLSSSLEQLSNANVQPLDPESDVSEELQKKFDAMNPRRREGEYGYYVVHYGYAGGKNKENKRTWVSHRLVQPFYCDEPDIRRARELYKRSTGMQLADDSQLELWRVDENKKSKAGAE